MDNPKITAHLQKRLNYTIFDVKWIPCSAKFVVIGAKPDGIGIIQIYELSGNEVNLVKEIEKKESLRCGSFGISSAQSRQLVLGDFSGRMQILDIERSEIPILNIQAHDDIINSLDTIGGNHLNCGAPEIVTGSHDGAVKVWDPRQSGAAVVHICGNSTNNEDCNNVRDCWAVAFGNSHNNEERSVVAGYDNGDIKLFDLRQLREVWGTTAKSGICSLEFDRRDIPMNKLAIGTLEGGLHVYDMTTKDSIKGFSCVTDNIAIRPLDTNEVTTGPKATVWAVKHLPQNPDIFASCGGGGAVRLWRHDDPLKRYKELDDEENGAPGMLHMLHSATVAAQPVNCLDWNPDKIGLGVCGSFDQYVRVFVTTKLNIY